MNQEAYIMSEQLFPLIREVHGKSYSPGTPIEPLATEFAVERGKNRKITSIRADITVIVNKQDIFHFECQIKNDSTMVLRMFEYDVHTALSYPKTISSNDEKCQNKNKICLQFPNSAVLYLQDNKNTPDKLSCQIKFQDGGIYEYEVPVLKVQTYSLKEIKEKHLCVLIPFLPLRFRKKMRYDKKTKKTWFVLEKEELTSFYQQLILILDEEVEQGYLSENNRSALLSLLSKSMIRVFYRDDTLIKEVIRMTEPILELEIEKYMKQSEESSRKYEQAVQQLENTSKELEWYKNLYTEKDSVISSLQEQIAALQKQVSLFMQPSTTK